MCSGFHSVVKSSSWTELFQLSELFLLVLGEKTLVGSAREWMQGESLGDSMVVTVLAEGEIQRTMLRAPCVRLCMGKEEANTRRTTYTALRIEISLSPTSRDAPRGFRVLRVRHVGGRHSAQYPTG
jgi:hypothetical protein